MRKKKKKKKKKKFSSCLSVDPAGLSIPPPEVLAEVGLGAVSSHLATFEAVASAPGATIVHAPGLPALKKPVMQNILEGQFIDFTELSPAKGRTKAVAGELEGQVLLLQASDLIQAKRVTPDLGTWLQCYALYSAVMLTKYPNRAVSLMMYAATVAKLSQKFRWPSWVVYNNSFRQEAAESGKTDWGKIDGSLHAQCFLGMALSSEGWCSLCKSLEHVTRSCPAMRHPRKHERSPPSSRFPASKQFKEAASICGNFNRNNGECRFMPKCNYRHICRKCHGPHPVSACQRKDSNP